jgi:hypothetical protein
MPRSDFNSLALGTRLASGLGRARQKYVFVPYRELAYVTASVQVGRGRIPLAKSINHRHFSLILKIVLGRSVPLSSPLIEVIILVILDGGTFASHKMLISCLS